MDAQRELLQAEAKEPVQRKEEGKQPNPTKPNQANLHQPGSSLLNNNKKQRPKAKVKAEGEGKEKKGEGKEGKECVYIQERRGEGAELGEQQRGFRSSVGRKIS